MKVNIVFVFTTCKSSYLTKLNSIRDYNKFLGFEKPVLQVASFLPRGVVFEDIKNWFSAAISSNFIRTKYYQREFKISVRCVCGSGLRCESVEFVYSARRCHVDMCRQSLSRTQLVAIVRRSFSNRFEGGGICWWWRSYEKKKWSSFKMAIHCVRVAAVPPWAGVGCAAPVRAAGAPRGAGGAAAPAPRRAPRPWPRRARSPRPARSTAAPPPARAAPRPVAANQAGRAHLHGSRYTRSARMYTAWCNMLKCRDM